jgi:hypothetical protein
MAETGITGFHFYTMNLEKVVMEIVERLGLAAATPRVRELPWTAVRICCPV